MDASPQSTIPQGGREPRISPRLRQVQILEHAEQFGFWWQSRRQVARRLGVPVSSFRYCLQTHAHRCQESRGPAALARFLETSEGLAFLHRLLAAVHLVFVQANDCGLRNVGWFLELTGLDEFLPSSYGAQQAFARQMEALLAEYGREEDQRLAAQMPPREISLCEDETFHPQICLVAIEPVSNFLLLEQYAPHRDTATWTQCLDERLAGWSVTVCQVTSDEAKALIAHAEQALGAHHSPELFHVQQDLVQATSLALAGQTAWAHQAVAEAQQVTALRQAELTAFRVPRSANCNGKWSRPRRPKPSCSSGWRSVNSVTNKRPRPATAWPGPTTPSIWKLAGRGKRRKSGYCDRSSMRCCYALSGSTEKTKGGQRRTGVANTTQAVTHRRPHQARERPPVSNASFR